MSYRIHGETISDGKPLAQGPAKQCEACGRVVKVVKWCSDGITPYDTIRTLVEPIACSPGARVRVGLFRRCAIEGSHLHEECRACGHCWLTAFAGKT